ncbi:hypothetical protein [Serratia aquatilis]|uniref:Uncharacterized protein n=1 Tax=Serratia aquatilis TaxID=1737515 RepID=A0ABV6EEI8_9GAMM
MNRVVNLLIIIAVLYCGYKVIESKNNNDILLGVAGKNDVCLMDKIEVTYIDFKRFSIYENGPKSWRGSASIKNKCRDSIGVQIRQVAVDKNGNPISVENYWPASINNIPPGRYDFSLKPIPYDERIVNFIVTPESIRKW